MFVVQVLMRYFYLRVWCFYEYLIQVGVYCTCELYSTGVSV